MHQVHVDIASAQLYDLIKAALRGEYVIIMTGDQQMVQLVPVNAPHQPRRPGSARGAIRMAADFDAPLTDFREYTGESPA